MTSFNNTIETVADILKIENDGTWEIVDSDTENNLVMIDYRAQTSSKKHGWIRGFVVDTNKKTKVCWPYLPNVNVVADKLQLSSHGTVDLSDETGQAVSINPDDHLIERGCEGTVIRVFFHNGKTYYATHRKLDASQSRWITTKNFSEMYDDLGGPRDLFYGSGDFSTVYQLDTVYYFLVCHSEVQIVTQHGAGRIIFLGTMEGSFGVLTVCSATVGHGDNTTVDRLLERFPRPTPLSLEAANAVLEGNQHPDYRLSHGDFVVITDKAASRTIKVMSRSYNWRSNIRNDDPNLEHFWFCLSSDAHLTGKRMLNDRDFMVRYPIVKIVDRRLIFNMINREEDIPMDLADETSDILRSCHKRIQLIFQIVVHILPPCQKSKMVAIYTEFFGHRKNTTDWLYSIYYGKVDTKQFEVVRSGKSQGNRVKQIIDEVTRFAEERNRNQLNPKLLPFDRLVFENIVNLIAKESGNSLYRVWKQLKNYNETSGN